jgi:PAS domain S-box-containing protein
MNNPESESLIIVFVNQDNGFRQQVEFIFPDFSFENQFLKLFWVSSIFEVQQLIESQHNIAMVVLDCQIISMEQNYRFLEYLRSELNNQCLQVIFALDSYDHLESLSNFFNYQSLQFKLKSELTNPQILFLTIVKTLENYQTQRRLQETQIENQQLKIQLHNYQHEIKKSAQDLTLKIKEKTQQLLNSNVILLQEIGERHRLEKALRQLTEELGYHNRDNFFQSLVSCLGETLEVEYVFITEIIDEQFGKVLAILEDRKLRETIKYHLDGTPCQKVFTTKQIMIFDGNVQQEFPQDVWLKNKGVISYLGCPIFAGNGEVLGIICLGSRKKFGNLKYLQDLTKVFAIRLGSELERYRMELALKESQEHLQKINQDLENIVKQRTLELSQVNKRLQKEINLNAKHSLEIQKGKQELNKILDSIEDVVWSYDFTTGKLNYINSSVQKIYGQSIKEFIENPNLWLEVVYQEDKQKVDQYFNLLLTTGFQSCEYRILHSDGQIRWVYDKATVTYDSEHNPIRIDGITSDITQKKAIEEELKNKNAQLQGIFETIPDLLFIIDKSEVILDYKTGNSQDLYLPPEQFLGKKMREILPAELNEQRQKAMVKLEQTKSLVKFEYSLEIEEEETYFEARLLPFQEEKIIVIVRNINEQKQAEMALVESEKRFRVIFEQAEIPIVVADLNGKLLQVNPHFCKFIGYEETELLNMWCSQIIHSEDLEQHLIYMQEILTKKRDNFSRKYRYIRKNNELRWGHGRVAGIKNIQGEVSYLIGVVEDIHERELAQQALQNQLNRTLLLQDITDAIRETLDINTIFTTTVKKVGETFKVNRCLIRSYENQASLNIPLVAEYLVGDFISMQNITIPLDKMFELREILQQGKPLVFHNVYEDPFLQNIIPFSEQIQLKSVLIVSTSSQGEMNGMISLHQCDHFRNWTEEEIDLLETIAGQLGIAIAHGKLLEKERKTKQKLQQQNLALQKATYEAQEANRVKSEFLSNMSHEIRTPLNAVLGFSELLANLITDSVPRSYVNSIRNSGKTLLALINDILDLSKIEAGKMQLHYEPINLIQVITEIEQIFWAKANKKNILVQSEISANFPKGIIFDEARLRQILFNLVGNAVKFTAQGYVKIMVNCQHQQKLDTEENNLTLEIAVKDTGIGISEKQQQYIFEAFRQAEGHSNRLYEGTGLGLTITKRLTEMLGGNISIESKLGVGSTFKLTFPNVAITQEDLPNQNLVISENNLAELQASKILVVDDVPSNLDLVKAYFDNTKHQLLFANNGEQAIEIALKNELDLILLDLKMPKMNGEQTAIFLKDNPQTKHIPIIILTASSIRDDQPLLVEICQGFLLKPISKKNLFIALSKFIPLVKPTDAEIKNQDIEERKNQQHDLESKSYCSLENVDLLRELKGKLEELEKTTVPQLLQRNILAEFRKFATNLRQLGNEYQCDLLVNYAVDLANQIEDFEIEKIPQTLANLAEIRGLLP